MKKLSLVIAEADRTYIESFARYIRNSEYTSRFDIKLFSKQEAINQYLTENERINILLTSPDMISDYQEGQGVDLIIYLSETDQQNEQGHYLKKYQPLGQILTEVLRLYYERDGTDLNRRTQSVSTQILATYSATGGTGKTTVAYTLARELANQGQSVIYLNLELINSVPLLFDLTDQPSSSPLLYYIKTDAEQFQEQFETYVVTDTETGIDFFNFIPSAEEMEDLTAEEVELFIQVLIQINKYSHIILDLDSAINPRTLAGLKLSDQTYWLLNNDMYSFHKTSYLFENLHALLNDAQLKDRVTFVLNRYTGHLDSNLADFDIKIDSYLPYIPDWKILTNREQLSMASVYSQHIQELLAKLNALKQGVI